MTTRQLIEVDADIIEAVAHRYGLNVEIAGDRGYLRVDGLTFVTELAPVAGVA